MVFRLFTSAFFCAEVVGIGSTVDPMCRFTHLDLRKACPTTCVWMVGVFHYCLTRNDGISNLTKSQSAAIQVEPKGARMLTSSH